MAVIKEISKGGNVAYYINQEKGVVVARINSDEFEPYSIVESITHKMRRADLKNTPFVLSFCGGFEKYTLDSYYIGCAKCSPEDTFDLETGKRIALAKAQAKYHNALCSKLNEVIEYLDQISERIEQRSSTEFDQAQRYEGEYHAV